MTHITKSRLPWLLGLGIKDMRLFLWVISLFCLTSGISVQAQGTEPWRLEDLLQTPDWLLMKGEQRTRYETLDEQFRAGLEGSDQALALRTSLLMQADLSPAKVTVELMDSRHYLQDEGSALDTTMVNSLEILQAHLEWNLGSLGHGRHYLRAGRETVDLGNRRLMSRNAFRNTINAYTGLDWRWEHGKDGPSVRALWVLPTQRQPDDLDSLLDNQPAFDDQDFDLQFWALYGSLPVTFGSRLEIYTFGLHESGNGTRHRQLYTPGLRWFRSPKKGTMDFELESAWQTGTVGSPRQDHFAHMQHLSIGYTFDHTWQPRLGLAYDYASGDRNPEDTKSGQFDTLYGARRFEFGPTGIYGAIRRNNLSSPEVRLSFKPSPKVEFMAAYRSLWLASAKDTWTASGARDSTGNSGRFAGQQLEARLRWDLLPGNLRLETGLAQIFPGNHSEEAPNGNGADTTYVYFEMTTWF